MKATLKDIETELWLRMRNKGIISWETKDGRTIPIKELEDTHLINIYNQLKAKDKSKNTSIESTSLGL